MSDNVNGGFPPLELIKEKIYEKEDIKNERFYAPSNLNILKILSTKKNETMIKKNNIIDTIDSL
jgi:hypothetical protein